MNKDNSLFNRIKELDLKNVIIVLSVLILIVLVWYLIIKFGIIPFLRYLKKYRIVCSMNLKKLKNYLIPNPQINGIRMFLPFIIMLVLLVIMLFNFKKIFDDLIVSLLNFLGEINKFLKNSN